MQLNVIMYVDVHTFAFAATCGAGRDFNVAICLLLLSCFTARCKHATCDDVTTLALQVATIKLHEQRRDDDNDDDSGPQTNIRVSQFFFCRLKDINSFAIKTLRFGHELLKA